jgi:DNA mismatch endonuclease, patch repair protein
MRPRTMRRIPRLRRIVRIPLNDLELIAVTDRVSKLQRSHIMRSVKQVGNLTTEVRFIEIMHSARIVGWRRRSKVEGKPDFIFPKARLAVFIDGCFWHGCPSCYSLPASNTDFWRAKLARNKARDRLVRKRLSKEGWRVLRIWECQLRSPKPIQRRLTLLLSRARND